MLPGYEPGFHEYLAHIGHAASFEHRVHGRAQPMPCVSFGCNRVMPLAGLGVALLRLVIEHVPERNRVAIQVTAAAAYIASVIHNPLMAWVCLRGKRSEAEREQNLLEGRGNQASYTPLRFVPDLRRLRLIGQTLTTLHQPLLSLGRERSGRDPRCYIR